jgi:hypothetical protein
MQASIHLLSSLFFSLLNKIDISISFLLFQKFHVFKLVSPTFIVLNISMINFVFLPFERCMFRNINLIHFRKSKTFVVKMSSFHY